MKLYNVLFTIEINTRIKTFIDDKKIGILYISPISSSLYKKRHYDIININVKNNILVFNLISNNNEINSEYNNNDLILLNILPLIGQKTNFKVFHNNTQVISTKEFLNNKIDKIFIENDTLYIVL